MAFDFSTCLQTVFVASDKQTNRVDLFIRVGSTPKMEARLAKNKGQPV
jgi:hypothetical protein